MLALGIPNRRELLSRMSALDLAEWREWYRLNPWGDDRADLRSALAVCKIANPWRPRQHQLKLRDLMPFEQPARRRKLPTPEELAVKITNAFSNVAAAQGA